MKRGTRTEATNMGFSSGSHYNDRQYKPMKKFLNGMSMKSTVLIVLINLIFSFAIEAQKVIIKANILRGDSFVTANTNPQDIENILKASLTQKGFQVVSEIDIDEDIFYIDVFVFQYPADFPTISLTIRTKGGIHFIDKERVKLFGDRNSANLKLASKLAERVPSNINTEIFYDLTLKNLLSNDRVSLIGLSSNAITKGYRSNYSSIINWFDYKESDFIIPNGFDEYAKYSSNFQSIRRKLKGKDIRLKLKINHSARFELTDIISPIKLTEKQKTKIKQFIDSFPLWIVNEQVENIEMKIGVN